MLRNQILPTPAFYVLFELVCILFSLWFPLCRGEADLLVTAKYGYFRNLLPLVSVVDIFSPFIFLLCLSQISLFTHSSHLSGGLPRFLEPSCFFVSALFGSLSSFIWSMCPAHFIRLLTILPTIQALVPTSFFLQVFHSSSLHFPYSGYFPYPFVLT